MTLVQKIKKSEGFRGNPYDDHLNNPTIGYGTLLPITEDEAELLLQHRLQIMIDELVNNKPFVTNLSDKRQEVLYEMAYQLGVPNTLKFKKMWEAIQNKDFDKAGIEMILSKWYEQTPNRVKQLAKNMVEG